MTYDLFLAVLVARDQVDRFHMTSVHFVAEDVRENDLGQVLFLLISVQAAIWESETA